MSRRSSRRSDGACGQLAPRPGIGLRSQHYDAFLETRPPIAWVEVHSENYFGDGGRPLEVLQRTRANYPVSFHGVGLSLGSTDPLDRHHLRRLATLVAQFEPALVSEHLSWSSVRGRYFNDLLPLPYTGEALRHMIDRVAEVQDHLGRRMLIENPSTYLEFADSSIREPEFLAELARRSGCGLLLDINNVYVNSINHGWNAGEYLERIPARAVEEIHLAGHTRRELPDGVMLIDSHNAPVCEPVWDLFHHAVQRWGAKPTLIEWDQDLPALNVLLDEAARAGAALEEHHAIAS